MSWEGTCCEYVPGRKHITIYPDGETLNREVAEKIAFNSPATFRAAQELLDLTEKFVKQKGWFTSSEKRHARMVAAYGRFIRAFTAEGIFKDEIAAHGMKYAVISYLDEMSAAFPNWQDTYAFLDFFIWECTPEQK